MRNKERKSGIRRSDGIAARHPAVVAGTLAVSLVSIAAAVWWGSGAARKTPAKKIAAQGYTEPNTRAAIVSPPLADSPRAVSAAATATPDPERGTTGLGDPPCATSDLIAAANIRSSLPQQGVADAAGNGYISVFAGSQGCGTARADNTLGSWKYNVAKSKQAAGASPITRLTVTRETTGDGAKVSAKGVREDGSKIDTVTAARYDGEEVTVRGTGLSWDTSAIRQVDANTISEERSKKGGRYRSAARTVVSKDGRTLTVTATGTDADGTAFATIAVFSKQ